MHEIFEGVFELCLRAFGELLGWRFVLGLMAAALVSAYGFYGFGVPAGWYVLGGSLFVFGGLGAWWSVRNR